MQEELLITIKIPSAQPINLSEVYLLFLMRHDQPNVLILFLC
ncbi:hypothetical protein L313_1842 [Acinetobacter haemolyticus CIP 64.3 = MTCC 9819]|nr:hypothetical protein L313_1842 [Acinetobacter haemolyticus CIP 64.3 = MTCC 9819]